MLVVTPAPNPQPQPWRLWHWLQQTERTAIIRERLTDWILAVVAIPIVDTKATHKNQRHTKCERAVHSCVCKFQNRSRQHVACIWMKCNRTGVLPVKNSFERLSFRSCTQPAPPPPGEKTPCLFNPVEQWETRNETCIIFSSAPELCAKLESGLAFGQLRQSPVKEFLHYNRRIISLYIAIADWDASGRTRARDFPLRLWA